MVEEWKDVVGFEGLYQVSNLGRVKSLDREYIDKKGVTQHRKGQILKPKRTNSGYPSIHLRSKDIDIYVSLHRLVAEAFIPNPNGYKTVNHKDEDKNNNAAINLEWCTQAYNNSYGTAKQRSALKQSVSIDQFDKSGKFIQSWQSSEEVQRQTGIWATNVRRCCKGIVNTAGGYKWEYTKTT